MDLRTADPRKLKANPNNPRRSGAGDFPDAQMLASIRSIGLVQPPLVKAVGKKLVIVARHRRVTACVAAGLTEIPVLVMAADATNDPMRSVSENLVRAEMGQVDRWRSMESLVAAGWNEAAIAAALGMTPRNIAQARLLAHICPAMLDQMARNDLPDPRALRIIAAATTDEQAEVWKQHRPRRGQGASWGEISHALSKTRMRATDAKFGADAVQAFGIVWHEDLFAPADEDSRSTTQVEAFLAAQHAWLEANLPAGRTIVTMDDYGRPKLPKGAQPHYGRPGAGVLTAFAIDARSGTIREQPYTLPPGRLGAVAGDDATETVRKPRPDLTAKGAAMVGDLRTDALHQALREKPIGDDRLIGLLVLALGGRNVTVLSGVAGRTRGNTLGSIANSLTDGGVLTGDLGRLRHAAREALVEVLSCRDNPSASGLNARHAGTAIDADAFLPNMATEAFLSALSRPALEQCAAAHEIAPGSRVKDTRAAMVSHFRDGTFVYPGARFAPTEVELQARRNAARPFQDGAGDDDDDEIGDGEDDDQDEDGAPNHGAPDETELVRATA